MLSEVKKNFRIQNSTLTLVGRGWGRQGKGISISTVQKGVILWKCVNSFVPHCRYTTTKPTLKIECVRCVPAATCVCQMKQIRQNNIGIFTTLTLATDFYKKMFCLYDNNQFIILRPEKSGLEKIPCILTVY